ncbi:MAG TPA: hypothetical protein VFG99_04785, partial [Chloroflexia bacterium]|nr:hypothetical protein [Chloroflexia bacterium]
STPNPVSPLQTAPTVLHQAELPGNGSRTFPETGKTVRGLFLDYWDAHGGLAQQGYPISELLSEKSDLDGKSYTVQYFERAVFEYHPENQPPYNVLLSQLGTFQYKKKYPNGAPNQQPNNEAGSQLFTQTGKRLGGKFLTYWQTHGGLAQQGYPISDQFVEVNDLNGKAYTVQYFERAVFELHPENAGTPYEVLLSQLGTFRYQEKYQSPTPGPTSLPATPLPGATATGTRPSSGAGPPARAGHDLVYHDSLKLVLLVNGDDEGQPAGTPSKIWGWDGREWRVVTSGGPEARSLGGVAYDPGRNVLVMYGGSTQDRVFSDTWEWDGRAWSKKDVTGPGLLHHTSMVYDAERKELVMYGGNLQATESTRSDITFPEDTWTWNGQAWRKAATQGLGPRYHYAITYDAARKVALIFGGATRSGNRNDIWGWNGAAWSEYLPQGPEPSARSAARMAFDERSGKTILFGGVAGRSTLDDTWEWDGTGWRRLDVSGARPPARSHHAMAYDRNRGRIVLFSGINDINLPPQLTDTWEWDGSSWTKVAGP